MQGALARVETAASDSPSLPVLARRLLSPSSAPAHLRMDRLGVDSRLVRVSFSLGRLRALSPCELEVARWANEGHPNPAIASLRQTSIHTVARHMANLLAKLHIGARLDLATIPELNAWAPPRLQIPANDGAGNAWLSAKGLAVDPQEVASIWCEMAAGQWVALSSIDTAALTHVMLRRVSGAPVAWAALQTRERDVLDLVARRFAQKVIAIKLGLAPSTVSAALRSARSRLGFTSFGRLVRAYCAAREVLDETSQGFGDPSLPGATQERTLLGGQPVRQ